MECVHQQKLTFTRQLQLQFRWSSRDTSAVRRNGLPPVDPRGFLVPTPPVLKKIVAKKVRQRRFHRRRWRINEDGISPAVVAKGWPKRDHPVQRLSRACPRCGVVGRVCWSGPVGFGANIYNVKPSVAESHTGYRTLRGFLTVVSWRTYGLGLEKTDCNRR